VASTLRYNGKRDKGRPRRRWIDDIDDATNIVQQAHHKAVSITLHLNSTLQGIRKQRKEDEKEMF
jgi:hypothetical protein